VFVAAQSCQGDTQTGLRHHIDCWYGNGEDPNILDATFIQAKR
jgi:hypothetical protein